MLRWVYTIRLLDSHDHDCTGLCARNEPKQHYLLEAIADMKKNRPLELAATTAPGCDLATGSVDGIEYDFWTPKNVTPGRILLYSHGGGYVMF